MPGSGAAPKPGRLREHLKQIVCGGNDGIVTTFSVVAGFAGYGAEGDARAVAGILARHPEVPARLRAPAAAPALRPPRPGARDLPSLGRRR